MKRRINHAYWVNIPVIYSGWPTRAEKIVLLLAALFLLGFTLYFDRGAGL